MFVQTSTANPYGHRPWQTSLYTTFGDFGWLKQPQNLVERESPAIRPRIRRPPERATLGAIALVSGSGRVLGTLGLDLTPAEARFAAFYRMAGGRAPYVPQRLQSQIAPAPTVRVASETPPPVAPITVLPPTSVPPPANTVVGPYGKIYLYTPGAPGQAGSPFPPPAPGEYPGSPSAAVAAPAPGLFDQAMSWLGDQTISGVPNWLLAGGVGLLLFSRSRNKGRF